MLVVSIAFSAGKMDEAAYTSVYGSAKAGAQG